jgi:hypothetical protein
MPEFKMGCDVLLAGGTHDHHCYRERGHDGTHACYCGVNWDKEGRISIRRVGRRRRR